MDVGRVEFAPGYDGGPRRDLRAMEVLAQPLDEWCEICELRLATAGRNGDGVAACIQCAERTLIEMGVKPANRSAARARKRAARKHGRGYTR